MSFATLGLRAELLSAVTAEGYETPTPIQLKAIPAVLAGRDVMAGAQTGTGKTAAFALPMLQLLSDRRATDHRPRALILTPTRELANQIQDNLVSFGKNLSLRSTAIFGGVGAQPQIDRLRSGVDILTACPGRLLDLAGQGVLDLTAIEFLVLDEADRMLDMGFIHDIRRVLKLLPQKRRNLLFSATYSPEIEKLAHTFLRDPEVVAVARRNTAAETVSHRMHPVEKKQKNAMLSHLIYEEQWTQVLVFTRTKHGANKLAKFLNADGISAAAIHGNKSQSARTAALQGFKDGRVEVLVATDIASRGLDIEMLPVVVNYELPNVPEDYIHRIGRTGRAGASGLAISLVTGEEVPLLRGIERLLKQRIPSSTIRLPETPTPRRPAVEPIAPAPQPSPRRSAVAGARTGRRNDGPQESIGDAPRRRRRRRTSHATGSRDDAQQQHHQQRPQQPGQQQQRPSQQRSQRPSEPELRSAASGDTSSGTGNRRPRRRRRSSAPRPA